MRGTKYQTAEEILHHAQDAIGKPLGTIDKTGRLSTGKGSIGTVIEESWFGYRPNSESEPDFPEAGIELKVIPFVRKKDEIKAKERLVCNIIDYMEEYKKTFPESSFWHKCHKMLLMAYEHKYGTPKSEYAIQAALLFEFPKEDQIIIEQDWNKIIQKIRTGKAHEISEGDTLYLAACTKGATAATVRRQPFSDILAKQRAYSLKQSYMTQILRKYVFGEETSPSIITDWHQLEHESFEQYLIDKIEPYYGMTQQQLKTRFDIRTNPKNINEVILARILGVSGQISATEEFKKASILPKTIRIQRNGSIKESISFPAFKFIPLSQETVWEDSELYGMLAEKKFMFVIFKENLAGEFVLKKVLFWNMPNEDLDQVELVWRKTVETIREGVVITNVNGRNHNNLPKQSENPVAHVRPHGTNAADTDLLPDGRRMTKQCFWLNRSYVRKQIEKIMNN
jgi:DNA mismatch repair protein MutH